MVKGPFLTIEDLKSAFSLFCCIYGVGTLGMPGNFARAGPTLALIAMAFMAFANIYASVAMSKVMILAPKSVKTFSDLGEWSLGGATGRWVSNVSQISSCLLIPCAFLVLGGQLLDGLFPDAFSPSTWTVFMALMVLPVCLVPTLKEGSTAAFAGCLGTILADIIGVAVVMYGMRGHPSVPFPELEFSQVASVFGNLSLAYGAGIVIPDIQRQHSDPTRMPRVILLTISFISVLFVVLSTTAYSAVGCQLSGNLLFSIYPDSVTGMSPLGFIPSWGAVVLAYLFMQLHITIAFAVILNPALYLAERMFLGMHKRKVDDMDPECGYQEHTSPANVQSKQLDVTESSNTGELLAQSNRRSKTSYVSVANTDRVFHNSAEEEAAEYRGGNVIKYVALRIFLVVILVVVAIVARDHFSSFVDFVGASCITLNCILLPIIFYLVKKWEQVPLYEKIPALVVIVVCSVLGCYVTYTSGRDLFTPTDSDVAFPFCSAEFENTVYYNYTAVHGV